MDHFKCAITMNFPYDPVTCPCGHIFERKAIEKWLERSETCPISREHLALGMLNTEKFIRKVIHLTNPDLEEYTEDDNISTDSSDGPLEPMSQMDIDVENEDFFVPTNTPFAYQGHDGYESHLIADITFDGAFINLDYESEADESAALSAGDINAHFRRVHRLHRDIEVFGYIYKYRLYSTEESDFTLQRRLAQEGYYVWKFKRNENLPYHFLYTLSRLRNNNEHLLERHTT